MGNDVFANGREIACKAADGKALCAFPDVAFTPPQTPATPPGVPIPYPNTAFAKDTAKGSKKVKISGKEVMLKNQSHFKTSTGDEAGAAPKKGILTSKTKGKVYFNAWSMDVKFEGQNVVRHLDLTTHNHASPLANSPPWLYQDQMAFDKSGGKVCEDEKKSAEEKCESSAQTFDSNAKPAGRNCTKACKEAQKCVLVAKKDDKKACCKEDTTGHHLIEVHCFKPTGERQTGALEGLESYDDEAAPCVCASRPRDDGTHGVLHAVQGKIEAAYNDVGKVNCEWENSGKTGKGENVSKWKYKDARDTGVLAHKTAFPHCNAICIKLQLDEFHKEKCGMKENTPLRTDPQAANRSSAADSLTGAQKKAISDGVNAVKSVTKGKGAL